MAHISHSERVKKIKSTINNNKFFTAIAAILIIFLIGSSILHKPAEDTAIEDTTINEEQPEKEEERTNHWRFYWTDLWILVIGGGFCTVMIIRERRKAKDVL